MRIYALPVHFRCMGSIFYGGKTPFGVKIMGTRII